ncbi:geranylgeranylglycerol-phosphate geranylgeranyltransferase [Nonlabens spongiae]|uniref:geranylgeranylglycerol-phosphate geranylgeranyltransferase n=1 Tax=Nonlabens spongiae TaxID=331648 RepID=UPI001B80332C|nr:geranylgeranylglycerol-phosphate geranylgeranyltransferase [Nonlabens spongiae]
MTFLKLIRWPNVLMTIVAQVVVYQALIEPSGLLLAMETWELVLLILSTALLTASGNVINDIQDIAVDKINKPDKVIVGKKMTYKSAFSIYMALTITAVVMGFIVANAIDKPILASVFIIVSFTLYSYATTLKSILLVGNILISLLVGLSVLIVGVFEFYPIAEMHSPAQLAAVMKPILYFSFGAFLINLYREWIKDCEDVNGDRLGGRNSMALVLGRQRAARLTSVLIMLTVVVMGYLAVVYFAADQVTLLYWIFLLMAPLSIVGIQLWAADSPAKFHKLSLIMKITMLLGVLFMFFYQADSFSDF